VPSSFAHAAVAVIANPVLDRLDREPSLVLVAAAAAVAPDLDTISWAFHGGRGPLSAAHRGLTHSFAAAIAAAALLTVVVHWRASPHSTARVFGYFALVVASHGLLDTLSGYGDGVALLAPFSNQRYRAPWSLFGGLVSEIVLLWLPALVFLRFNIGGFHGSPMRGPDERTSTSRPAG
jgi:inner membrane protein